MRPKINSVSKSLLYGSSAGLLARSPTRSLVQISRTPSHYLASIRPIAPNSHRKIVGGVIIVSPATLLPYVFNFHPPRAQYIYLTPIVTRFYHCSELVTVDHRQPIHRRQRRYSPVTMSFTSPTSMAPSLLEIGECRYILGFSSDCPASYYLPGERDSSERAGTCCGFSWNTDNPF